MDYNEVTAAALDLLGEPTTAFGATSSGRWSASEIARATKTSVGYVLDILGEDIKIITISTEDGDDVYDLGKDYRSSSRVKIGSSDILIVSPSTLPTTDVNGVPRQCSIVGGHEESPQLVLWPVPDAEYTVDVFSTSLPNLGTDSIIPVADIYFDTVMFGIASVLSKKLTADRNNNADLFEMERNKSFNQVAVMNINTQITSNWPHG